MQKLKKLLSKFPFIPLRFRLSIILSMATAGDDESFSFLLSIAKESSNVRGILFNSFSSTRKGNKGEIIIILLSKLLREVLNRIAEENDESFSFLTSVYQECSFTTKSAFLKIMVDWAASGDEKALAFLNVIAREIADARRFLFHDFTQTPNKTHNKILSGIFFIYIKETMDELQYLISQGAYQGGTYSHLETKADIVVSNLNNQAKSVLIRGISPQQKLSLIQLKNSLEDGRSTYSENVYSEYSANCGGDTCYDDDSHEVQRELYPPKLDF